MKNKNRGAPVLSLLLVFCFMFFSACSQSADEYVTESTSTLTSQTVRSDEMVSENGPYETTTNADRSSDDWKMAYIEYVRHGDGGNRSSGNYDVPWDEYTYFSLVDVDGDSIPELYRSGGFVAQGEALLTYANGKLIVIDSYASGYAFEGNTGYLWREERDRENDIEYYRYYKFDHGNMKLLLEAAEIDPTADRTEKYVWDGKEVSKEKFDELRSNKIKDNPKTYADGVLAEDMIVAINDF